MVLLHGGAGLTRRSANFRAYAGELAAQGFVLLLPQYFDATHSETMGTPTREKFSLWQRAVRDGIAWLRARPDVSRVALLGFSLGGFLAVDTDRSPGSAGEDAWRRTVSFLRSH